MLTQGSQVRKAAQGNGKSSQQVFLGITLPQLLSFFLAILMPRKLQGGLCSALKKLFTRKAEAVSGLQLPLLPNVSFACNSRFNGISKSISVKS